MESQNPPEATLALDSLRRIVRALRVSSHQAEKRHDLSGAQLFVLQQLATPALSLRELARRTLTDPSSISVVVARLEARGLVERQRSAADARRSEMSLTAEGRALARRAPEPIQVRLVAALGRMPLRELRTLTRLLAWLVDETGIAGEEAAMFFEESAKAPAKRAAAKKKGASRAVANRALANRAVANRAVANRALANRAVANRAPANRAAAEKKGAKRHARA